MARSLGQLTIDLVARIGGFTQGMSQAERVAQDRSRKIQGAFTKLQRSVSGLFAGLGAAVLVRSIIKATSEAEEAMGLLRNAVEQNGGAAGRTTQQLAGMATELQRVTTHGDEAIMGAQQLLLRFQSIQGVNFDRAVESTLDLATALGTDLKAAALLVGKALEAPQKGMTQLERSGVVLDKAQRELIKRFVETGQQAAAQDALLDGLEQRYKGAAAAARDTFGGALKGLQNAAGDLLEAKSGLPAVTEEINRLTDALSDPNTAKGIDTFVSGVIRIGSAIGQLGGAAGSLIGEVIRETAIIPSLMADSLKDTLRITTDVELLERQLRDIERNNKSVFIGKIPWLDQYSPEQLREMRGEIEATLKLLSGVGSGPTTRGRGGRSAIEPIPTEEFLKLEARLQEQIALYGAVGEAAKYAYQIQTGQLDDLSTKEQQRVLSLARQYDGIVKRTEVEKEAAAEAKRLADEQQRAQEQIESSYNAQVDSLRRQLSLTAEATELEQLRYELANGALGAITAAQRETLEGLASEVDLMRERADLEERVKSVIEETLTPLEQYQNTIAELNELREESNRLLGENGLGEQAYARAVEAAQKTLEDATNKSNEFLLEMARNTQDILADTLFGAMEGKIDNIGKAFLQMLNQMVAQAIAADLAKKLFGDISGDSAGGGGWLDRAFGFASSLFGRSSGGPVAAGSMYRVNEMGRPELLSVGNRDYLMMGNQSGRVVQAGQSGRSGGGVNVTQNIAVQGRVDERSSSQLAMDTARRMRLAQRLA